MIVRRLRQLVPHSVLADRCVILLVCYLDDSGKDPQNRIITVAGYAATEEKWAAFETEVEPIFAYYKVDAFHAMDLHNTHNDFEGWTVLKKQAFVAQICRILAKYAILGVSMSALKDAYHKREGKSFRKKTVTPYTFCTHVILDWLLTDIRVGRIANIDGMALILESGNEHNEEAKWNSYQISQLHNLGDTLRSVTFVAKASCRAIQMADLYAFYSRRHGAAIERAPTKKRPELQRNPRDAMLKIIVERCAHRSFLALDFASAAEDFFQRRDEQLS